MARTDETVNRVHSSVVESGISKRVAYLTIMLIPMKKETF